MPIEKVTGQIPCNYAIIDGFLNEDELKDINKAWPANDWEGWVKYDQRYEAKRASNLFTKLPETCAVALAKMARYNLGSLVELPDAVPDLSLHGGGLHECLPGGKLDCHLDAETHPRLGLRRAYSAVLYVHQFWKNSYHGEFVLCDDEKKIIKRVEPLPGRLVVFDCRTTYHGVMPVWHAGESRRSLALFGYLPICIENGRTRAEFTPWPGQEDLEKIMASR